MSVDNPMVRFAGVSKRFTKGKETISIFEHLDMTIPRGDFVAIMGPSGSGKTTLLNMLGGIDTPTAGEISFGGQRIDQYNERQLSKWRSDHVGFIFQFYNLMPMLNAAQNVELPLLLKPLSASQRKKNAAA